MKPNKPFETFENRVKQFEQTEKLRRDTDTLREKTNVKKVIDALNPENPYLRARLKVLADYQEWTRNSIMEMERTGEINNRHYDNFVRDVMTLGDSFSDEKA